MIFSTLHLNVNHLNFCPCYFNIIVKKKKKAKNELITTGVVSILDSSAKITQNLLYVRTIC